tara:strand:- start:5801 stop:6178 length:378 start_codon:yes stop_codon:yes gene_type:complete
MRKTKIALIACVKEKSLHPCAAEDMYLSEDFKSWFKYAQNWEADLIFILSGKYGLLELADVIEPYDFNLNDQPRSFRLEWSVQVLKTLALHCDLKEDQFILLTNQLYAEYLLPHIGMVCMPMDIK